MAYMNKNNYRFSNHLNSKWVTENCRQIATPTGLEALYSKLLTNKEISQNLVQTIHLKGNMNILLATPLEKIMPFDAFWDHVNSRRFRWTWFHFNFILTSHFNLLLFLTCNDHRKKEVLKHSCKF